MREAKINNGLVELKTSYDPNLILAIKKFPGREWVSEKKIWTVPASIALWNWLGAEKFTCDTLLTSWAEEEQKPPAEEFENIRGLKLDLFPYQKEGVARIQKFNGRALLADDMGLGKTPQAIAWLQLNKKIRPAVIICPASLKEMWAGKIKEWMGKEIVEVLAGKPKEGAKLAKASIYIINYDILGNKIITTERDNGTKKRTEKENTGWVDYLIGQEIQAVVADEAHYMKNQKSQRGVGVAKLMKTSPYILALTGTPIVNKPAEFWPIISILAPHMFRDFFKFGRRYCDGKKNGFGWDFNGSSNREELHQLLVDTMMIRRLKSEVLTQLPPKIRAVVPLPISSSAMKAYKKFEVELQGMIDEEGNKIQAIAIISHLKQAAVTAKMDAACEWIVDFMESGEKLIVFAHHHATVDALIEKFSKVTKIATITGRTVGSKAAQEAMFQNDPECRLFIGSKSAKEGLTLTAASNVAFIEIWDTPGDMAQAEDRPHRIGQKDQVTAWYLVAAGTLEEDIAHMVDRKLRIIKEVVDGREAQTEDLISELLRIAKEKR